MNDQRPPVDVKRSGLPVTAAVFADDAIGDHNTPGQVELCDGYLVLACPGCGYTSGITIGHPKPAKSPSWDVVDGKYDPATLTLQPSINCVNCCGWHGWLTAGVFNSC